MQRPNRAPTSDPVEEISTVLPVRAGVAFEVFADIMEVPRWMSVVRSVRVLERSANGRPAQVAFLLRMERATIGYILHYSYDPKNLLVRWETGPESQSQVHGQAQFMALSAGSCMLTYRISLKMPFWVPWGDSSYDGHVASAVVLEFREHLRRLG